MPPISVVIPTSGNPDRLETVLAGLHKQQFTDFDVYVCDDGTDDRTAEVTATWSKHLDVHCSRTNAGRGAGYARNRGIEASTGERVLFLDDDCVPDRDVVGFHAGFGGRAVGLVGLRRMVPPDFHSMLRYEVSNGELKYVRWEPERRMEGAQHARIVRLGRQGADALFKFAWTCHVSYPRDKLVEAGGFWEEFRGAGFEDLELALRLTRCRVALQPFDRPVVYHLNHPQTHHQSENYAHNQALYRRTLADRKLVRHGSGSLNLK